MAMKKRKMADNTTEELRKAGKIILLVGLIAVLFAMVGGFGMLPYPYGIVALVLVEGSFTLMVYGLLRKRKGEEK